jgi:hypothetical protein
MITARLAESSAGIRTDLIQHAWGQSLLWGDWADDDFVEPDRIDDDEYRQLISIHDLMDL